MTNQCFLTEQEVRKFEWWKALNMADIKPYGCTYYQWTIQSCTHFYSMFYHKSANKQQTKNSHLQREIGREAWDMAQSLNYLHTTIKTWTQYPTHKQSKTTMVVCNPSTGTRAHIWGFTGLQAYSANDTHTCIHTIIYIHVYTQWHTYMYTQHPGGVRERKFPLITSHLSTLYWDIKTP